MNHINALKQVVSVNNSSTNILAQVGKEGSVVFDGTIIGAGPYLNTMDRNLEYGILYKTTKADMPENQYIETTPLIDQYKPMGTHENILPPALLDLASYGTNSKAIIFQIEHKLSRTGINASNAIHIPEVRSQGKHYICTLRTEARPAKPVYFQAYAAFKNYETNVDNDEIVMVEITTTGDVLVHDFNLAKLALYRLIFSGIYI